MLWGGQAAERFHVPIGLNLHGRLHQIGASVEVPLGPGVLLHGEDSGHHQGGPQTHHEFAVTDVVTRLA